jgi:hypothetical protein
MDRLPGVRCGDEEEVLAWHDLMSIEDPGQAPAEREHQSSASLPET